MSMDGQVNLQPPAIASSTTTAGRGPRTGKNISRLVGISRRTIFPRKYSTSSNKEQGLHEQESPDYGCACSTPLGAIHHASLFAPFVRHVRSDENHNVDRSVQAVRGPGQPCRAPFRSHR